MELHGRHRRLRSAHEAHGLFVPGGVERIEILAVVRRVSVVVVRVLGQLCFGVAPSASTAPVTYA